MNIKGDNSHLIFLFALFFSLTFYFLRSLIDSNPIVADGYQNLSIAKNIVDHFVFSSGKTGGLAPLPDMVREPAWPILNAIFLYSLSLDYPVEVLATEFSNYFKFFNLVIYALIASTACCWIFLKTNKLIFSIFVFFLFILIYGTTPRLINNYNNEALATAFLLISSILFHETLSIKRGGSFILLGLALGFLALTKAQYLFISVPLVFILFYFDRKKSALSLIAFIIVVSPWIIRNNQLFNEPTISERGKTVAAVRVALTSELTSDELLCMAYAFTHPALQYYVGKTFGINNGDFIRGGKCQRLNRETCFDMGTKKVECAPFPEDQISSEYTSKLQLFYKGFCAGQQMEKGGLCFADFFTPSTDFLFRYIETFPLFAWRGMGFSDHPIIAIAVSISAIALFFTRYWSFSLLCVTSWFFHVALTHNIPRYHATLFPVMIISFVLLIHLGLTNYKSVALKKLSNNRLTKDIGL